MKIIKRIIATTVIVTIVVFVGYVGYMFYLMNGVFH